MCKMLTSEDSFHNFKFYDLSFKQPLLCINTYSKVYTVYHEKAAVNFYTQNHLTKVSVILKCNNTLHRNTVSRIKMILLKWNVLII